MRLDFGLQGWLRGWTEKKEEEKKKEENFLLCESIGHRPLRGRCPKGEEEKEVKEEESEG